MVGLVSEDLALTDKRPSPSPWMKCVCIEMVILLHSAKRDESLGMS